MKEKPNRRLFFKSLSAGLIGAGLASCVAINTTRGSKYTGPISDNFNGREFFNPKGLSGNSLGNLIKWRRTRTPSKWPQWVENTATPSLPMNLSSGQRAVTFINHCTFLIQLPELNILTDPVFSDRVSPVSWAGPKRVRAPGLSFSELPKIDVVLISHSHFDHLDIPSLIELNRRHKPLFVTGLGNERILAKEDIDNCVTLDWWQSFTHPHETKLTFVPAQHWTSRSAFSRNQTLWGGFYIESKDAQKLYFAGDTAWFDGFAKIQSKLGAPDEAFLPIGAYEPEWFMKHSHISPKDAVLAHKTLGAKRSIAMHFDCFNLADEDFGEAEFALINERESAGLPKDSFIIPETGQTVLS